MTSITPPPGAVAWSEVRTRLDQSLPFANMRDTPYYRDCVWEQFSSEEYDRRYAALRGKMREHKLDAIIVPGGPSHWSFGGAHDLAHRPLGMARARCLRAGAARRRADHDLLDGRHPCGGGAPAGRRSRSRTCATAATASYAEVMVERLRELKLERGRIGLMEIDPRHGDYMPVNQYNMLRKELPDAELVFTKGFLHELRVDPLRGRARMRARRRRALRGRHGGDGRARQARREGI